MQITINVPKELEKRLRETSPDLDKEAREALGVYLFRKEKLTHYELGQFLGLDRLETDAFLVDRKEFAQSLSSAELDGEYQALAGISPKG